MNLSTGGALVNRFLDYRFSLIIGRVLEYNFLQRQGQIMLDKRISWIIGSGNSFIAKTN